MSTTKKRRKGSPKMLVCEVCGARLVPGVAHRCSVVNGNGNGDALRSFLLKLLIPLIVLTVGELVGGIWWAATMQAGQQTQQEQLRDLKSKVDQIESYFRRPVPQSWQMPLLPEAIYRINFSDLQSAPHVQAAPDRRKVIPLEVIHKFGLVPTRQLFGPWIRGEDGEPYDFDDVVAVIFEMTREHWQSKK